MDHINVETIEMPRIGFGTYKISGHDAETLVQKSLEIGYRHIDTAIVYGNESAVGSAIINSKIPRESIFLTTKLWHDNQGYDRAKECVKESLQRLKTDYLDCCLIHWATEGSLETWRALEEMYRDGTIKMIGLSNFHPHHYEKLKKIATIKPMVIQLERHPYLVQAELKEFYDNEGILTQAWSPLAKGKIFNDPLLNKLAIKYNTSVAQIVLAWHLQTGWIPLPKASSENRMKDNLESINLILSEQDLNLISSLDSNLRTGSNPDKYDF